MVFTNEQREFLEDLVEDQAEIDKRSFKKYGVKWRTTKSGHKIGIDKKGRLSKGNPTLIQRIKRSVRALKRRFQNRGSRKVMHLTKG